MKDIKMSDVFDLPINAELGYVDTDATAIYIDNDPSLSNDQIECAEYAINNHDRLVQELEQSKSNLNELIEFVSNIQIGAEYSYDLYALINKIQGGE